MADKFGAAHRKLIQDTNDGNVAPPPKELTTSISHSGRTKTEYGDDGKSQLAQGLLSLGQKVLGGMKERQDERDFNEGYLKGMDEGFAENERSPIKDLLFGPSPTLRGAQKRIVENDGRAWLGARMKAMDDDMKSLDEEEYQAELTSQLEKVLEQHEDPEIKSQIVAQATRNFETLARNHTQHRQAWIAQTNDAAVENTLDASIQNMRTAQKYGDTKTQVQMQEEASAMFDQPLDMDSDKWLETTNRVLIKHLAKGDDLSYRLAEQKGIIDMMLPMEQAKLSSAHQIFEKRNDRNFMKDTTILNSRIARGEATEAEILGYNSKYPEQSRAVNDLRGDLLKAQHTIAEERKKKAQNVDLYSSADVAFASLSAKEQRDAMTTQFNNMANDGLAKIRDEAIEAGTYQGDPEAAFTPKETMDYMIDNPMEFAQQWAMHPEVKTPMITNLATQMISNLRRENLDQDGVAAMQKQVDALKVFQSLDGGNFHSQFRSEQEAQMFSVYSYLVNDAGFDPINAARELRTIGDAEPIDIKDYQEDIEDNLSALKDDFLDQSPESQGWLGIWNNTPDNEQAFDLHLKNRLEDALVMYKGDMTKALPAAQAAVRRNGIVSNGQFIPGGRKLEIKGGTLEEYIRGVNADDNIRAQITNSGNGFASDVDYTTLQLSVNPFNKKSVIMHGRHETTGQPITIALNLPQSGKQFSTYGINSFTGYNPKLADTAERRAAFLRNNKLINAHKTVGKAIDKAMQ